MFRRIAREIKTVRAMVKMYCRDRHGGAHPPPKLRRAPSEASAKEGGLRLCRECAELVDYARARLNRCPFGGEKPTCAKCAIHCYRRAERERITAVMRYSGPRMLTRHPILALRHLLDGLSRPRNRALKRES